jgi:hypothetical protein
MNDVKGEDEADDTRAWDAGWDAHQRAQQGRLARLSLIEKLEWLEEAHRLARHLSRRDRVDRAPSDVPTENPPRE